jgi:hypothetical protein
MIRRFIDAGNRDLQQAQQTLKESFPRNQRQSEQATETMLTGKRKQYLHVTTIIC